jgi:uncharacterized protein YjbI with pentapeptide repeats
VAGQRNSPHTRVVASGESGSLPHTEYSWSTSDFDFRTVHFGDAEFGGVVFSGAARFNAATFIADARFGGATFSGTAWFREATFSGSARFDKVDFGTGAISFGGPTQWGPPAPVFDWDQDISQKPANVEPQDWPPAVVPAS